MNKINNTLPISAGGLIPARLDKASNIGEFKQTLWFDKEITHLQQLYKKPAPCPIKRPAKVREELHDSLHPTKVEQTCTHFAHHGKNWPRETNRLLIEPVHDLLEYGVYGKIEKKHLLHLLKKKTHG